MGFENFLGFGQKAALDMRSACAGVFFGFLLFLGGCGLIFWNEGDAVYNQCAIDIANRDVVEVSACKPDPQYDNKIIYTSCKIDTAKSVKNFTDSFYTNLGFNDSAMRIFTTAEMYQHEEYSETQGSGKNKQTIWKVRKGWYSGSRPISHTPSVSNPPFPSTLEKTDGVQTVYIGEGYVLQNDDINKVSTAKVMQAPKNITAFNAPFIAPSVVPIQESQLKPPQIRYENRYYTTVPVDMNPRIGDIRVYLSTTQPEKLASMMGKMVQSSEGYTFNEYLDDKCNGRGFLQIVGTSGTPVSRTELVERAQSSADFSKWLFRIGAFLLLWFGLHLIFAPIAVMPEFIPCIGGFISDLVGCLLCCFTCACASVIFLVIFAISWVYFRPVLGISLLCGAGVILAGLVFWRVRAKKNSSNLEGMQANV